MICWWGQGLLEHHQLTGRRLAVAISGDEGRAAKAIGGGRVLEAAASIQKLKLEIRKYE